MSLSEDRAALQLAVQWLDEALGTAAATTTNITNAGTVASVAENIDSLTGPFAAIMALNEDMERVTQGIAATKQEIEDYIGRMS
jgi:hypothetical protein